MTGAQRSKLSAIVLFALITLVVVGGMAWGTIVTFRLAEFNIQEDRRKEVRRVVSILDSHLRSILLPESLRTFTDYSSYDPVQPWVEWLRSVLDTLDRGNSDSSDFISSCVHKLRAEAEDQLRALDRDLARTRSDRLPLSEAASARNWIDLYFQVDDGRWSSPQFSSEDDGLYTVYSSGMSRHSRSRRLFEWLMQEMPMVRLADRVNAALTRDRVGETEGGERTSTAAPVASSRIVAPVSGGRNPAHDGRRMDDFHQRSRSKVAEQMQARPPTQAAPIRQGMLVNPSLGVDPSGAASEPPFSCISMSRELPATFWLDGMPGEGKKLAFVRTAYRDDMVVYQGFLGDWARLKNELLARIADVMPDADLMPVEQTQPSSEGLSDADLTWIPARLNVPEPKQSVASVAWRQVGGMLITTWVAALVVLSFAGWGVRNLVALTERRMQFAYAVTHELRTPLTTFRLYSEMLAGGMVPEESRADYLNTLHHESEKLAALVESVLEYSRLENHKVRLNPVPVDGSRLLEIIGKTLEERCRKGGVDPQARNLVPPGQTFVIDVDVVHQIAGVLINNACRHARASTHPRVALQLSTENDRLHLDVIDNGPGIERGDQRVIFKPYRRGRKADSSAQGGIGLGLALARNWARFVKGRLDLMARHHSELGGAHFRLTVPAIMEA